jgi:hypothetical protein
MKERKVFIEFDFRSGKISFDEDWCGNGRPMLEHDGMIHRHDIGKYLSIGDQEEAESNISAEQRAEFSQLWESGFETYHSNGHLKGRIGEELDNFIDALCEEIDEDMRCNILPGLLHIVDAHDVLDKDMVVSYGLTMLSTDQEIEKLVEEIDQICASDFHQDMQYTEQCLRDYRVALRENYEEKIQWIVTDDSNILGSFNDFDSAMDAAQELAEEQATPEERETLERWGDDMATGWGVCPANDSGGYWPQVHCEYKGKRIERLPWERG